MALYAPFMGGYLPILANYDDIIQIDSFAYNWCLKNHQNMIILDVEHWCYQTRRRGGMSWYCGFSQNCDVEWSNSYYFLNLHI